ncbi:LamG domain-containing protein [Rheinheimera salexigens]|uniref:LamG domain-containing protein n=1 Tax=Rheinheimera salexigens TaxID=1628148 RepID=UPI000A68F1C9|nr:LamG domain-containing protein [Rheinheimera salexigens]
MRYFILCMCSMFSILLLSGCGESAVEQNPPPPVQSDNSNYDGPAAQTEAIQQFKLSFWDNVASNDRCGACHTAGDTAPYFARNDDINLAYAAALPVVDLSDVSKSLVVTKVAGGHNCWLASDSACADTISQWLRNWASTTEAEAATITLVAPVIREPGSSKSLPEDSGLFSSSVYPLLRQHCVACHAPNAPQVQSPFFADENVSAAYQASQRLINLDSPELSRLVRRLADEFHNCWSDCANDAAVMLQAITDIADNVVVSELDPQLVPSKALRLDDGVVASSGGRFESNQIAFYQFKTGEGSIAYDTSGVEPAANLTMQGDIDWITGWGIKINQGRAQASTQSSKKLSQLMTATGEMSVEAWLIPANVSQMGPAAIVSYAGSATERNFTLGQSLYNYDFLLRRGASGADGLPAFSTADADELLQASLQHVVITHDPVKGQRIYVNGADSGVSAAPEAIRNWDDSYALMVGNEANGNRQWQGSVRMLALHNKALTAEQIGQNYAVGVGQKFYLLFSIADLIALPESYIVFEVAQFDEYSYLFNTPYVINLNGDSLPQDLNISGMAIGINGKEASIGQAWIKRQFSLAASTDLSQAQVLSEQGTIIAAERGVASDEFFLSFGQIGQFTNVRTGISVATQQITMQADQSADIGLRTFAKINASMSALTGVAQQQTAVANTYQTIRRQLPAADSIETFVSAQQMAVTQLGIAYCNAAINDDAIRNTWFAGINFNTSPDQTYTAAKKKPVFTTTARSVNAVIGLVGCLA